MSEKVKVKRGQLEIINIERMKNGDNTFIQCFIEGCYLKLKGLLLSELTKIMYVPNSYEVEEEWQTGDWVVTKSGYIGEIEFINEIEGWANIGYSKDTLKRGVCLAKTFNLDEIKRHATEQEIAQKKERRFFARHGREVWELKQGDFLVNSDKVAWEVTKVPEGENHCFLDYTKIYYDRIKKSYLVLCFAENRLDQ